MEPVHISGKRSNAVLLSEEDWRAIQETPLFVFDPRYGSLYSGRVELRRSKKPMRSSTGKHRYMSRLQNRLHKAGKEKMPKTASSSGLKPRIEELLESSV